MTLQPREEHPHGLSGGEFDTLFTSDKPIIFAYHGYPWLIHRLTYRRKLAEHREYITPYGQDMFEIREWTWGAPGEAEENGGNYMREKNGL